MKGRKRIAGAVAAAGTILLLSGCEDKELAAKSAAQKARLIELEADVEIQKRLLGDEPEGNPEEELKQAEAQLAETQAQVQELELQLDTLRAERAALEEEFEDYKREYRIEN